MYIFDKALASGFASVAESLTHSENPESLCTFLPVLPSAHLGCALAMIYSTFFILEGSIHVVPIIRYPYQVVSRGS